MLSTFRDLLVYSAICLILLPTQSFANSWLHNQTNIDGSYGLASDIATPLQATSEALRYFQDSNNLPPYGLSEPSNYIDSQGFHNTETLSRKIILNLQAGLDITSYTGALLSHKNLDGGYGELEGYASTVVDTAFAVEALTLSGHVPVTDASVAYLLEQQKGDGSWHSDGYASSTYVTALAVNALTPHRHLSSVVSESVNVAVSYLLGLRDVDGLWGSSFDSAQALLAILPNMSNPSSILPSIENLRTLQDYDGSWEGDAYVTALVLRVDDAYQTAIENPLLATIKGTVVDGITGNPITGVKVAISGAEIHSQYTDSYGSFNLEQIVDGRYTLDVSSAGYESLTTTVSIEEGRLLDLGVIALAKSLLSSTGTIKGTFTDIETGEALPGVTITVDGTGYGAVTAGDGSFQISNVEPGPVLLKAIKNGYSSVTAAGVVSSGGITFFSAALTPIVTPVTAIEGYVLDGVTALPLENVNVSLTGSTTVSAVTDSHGYYRIESLLPGALTIEMTATNYDALSATLTVYENNIISYSPTMYATGTTPGASNSSSVIGRVVDVSTALPVVGAEIIATFASSIVTASTNALGEFTVEGLEAGEGTIEIVKSGYTTNHIQLTLKPLTQLDLGVVNIQGSGITSFLPDLTLTALDSSSVTLDANGNQLSGSLQVIVNNSGSLAVSEGIDILAFSDLNQDGQYSENLDIYLGQVETIEQISPAGESVQFVPVAGSLPYRDAPISITVDQSQRVVEANEGNNTSTILKSCGATDLTISFLHMTQVPFAIHARIGNASTIASPDGVVVSFYEGNPAAAGVLLGETTIASIAGNAYDDISLVDPVLNGSIDIYAVIDAGGTLSECETLNNRIHIPGPSLKPDLLISEINSAALSTNPQTLIASGSLSVTIENKGTLASPSGVALVAFYDVNQNTAYDATIDTILADGQTLASINLASSEIVTLTINGELPFRDAPVSVWVDSLSVIEELNEENNVAASSAGSCSIASESEDMYQVIKQKWRWAGPSHDARADGVLGPVVVGQLSDDNGDGVIDTADMPDLVFPSFGAGNYLNVVSGADGSEIWSKKLDIASYGSPALGDIDNDGIVEIIIVGYKRLSLYALEHDGTVKWKVPNQNIPHINEPRDAPAIVDLDGDGTPEIVIGNNVYNADGSSRWNGRGDSGGRRSYGLMSIAADIDLDGSMDIIAGKTVYNFDGTEKWNISCCWDAYNAVGNFDGDKFAEVVSVVSGLVYLHEHNRYQKWRSPYIPGMNGGGPPTVADFDGDGEPEIGVAGAQYYVVIETNGSIKWKTPTGLIYDGSAQTGSSVFDFEGDGKAEVLYSDERNFYIFDGETGNVRYSLPIGSWTTLEYPVVADIDNDSRAEIIIGAGRSTSGVDGVIVLEHKNDTWAPTRSIWNQHSYHINNINDDGTIPKYEEPSWLSHNSYRLNTFVDGEPLSDADISASKLQVIDAMNGTLSFAVRIANGGTVASGSDISAAFYDGHPQSGGVLLGQVMTASLNPGEYRDLQLDGITTISGTQDIYVVVDADEIISECDEQNNILSVSPGVAKTGALSLSDNSSEFLPKTIASFNAVITNTSVLNGDYSLDLQLEDMDGNIVHHFVTQQVEGVTSGEVLSITSHWPVENTLAGNYLLRGSLRLLDESVVSTDLLAITIIQGLPSHPVATLNTAMQQAQYHTTATAYVNSTIQNLTENTIIDNAKLYTAIINEAGVEIFASTDDLGQLGISALRTVSVAYPFSDIAVGSYQVNSELRGGVDQQLYASSSTEYTVEVDYQIAISGAVDVQLIEVQSGDAQICYFEISNGSAQEITGLNLRKVLLDIDLNSEQILNQYSATLQGNRSYAMQENIDIHQLGSEHYACLLQVEIDHAWTTLGYRAFSVFANTPPVANAGYDMQVESGTQAILDGSASTDIDGNALSYLWTKRDAPLGSVAQLSHHDSPMPTFTADIEGSYTFQLVVNDGRSDSEPDNVILVAGTGNVAPVANAGDQRSVTIGDTVTLDGSASSDLNGDLLSFNWTLLESPEWSDAVLSDVTAIRPTIHIDLDGRYIIQLVVSDGSLESEVDTIILTTENVAPVANAGNDQQANVGEIVGLDGSNSYDINDDLLAYRWSLLLSPTGSESQLLDDTTVAPYLNMTHVGTHIAQLIVNDGSNDSVPDTVLIRDGAIRPVANAGVDQTLSAGSILSLDGRASWDGNGDDLSYQWHFTTLPNMAAVTLEGANSSMVTYHAYIAGLYVVQLIVDDGTMASVPDTAVVTVIDDVAPQIYDFELNPNPVDVDSGVYLSAMVEDALTGGAIIQSAEVSVNGGAYLPLYPVDGQFDSMSESVSINLSAFGYSNVYQVCVRGTDVLGNVGADTCQLLPVYDPDGGFVTGGGWIDSPVGACQLTIECDTATGKANFGFVSKYKKGTTVPTGNTNFVFKSGDIKFHSEHYEWLVVAGSAAKFKGTGQINGQGNYGFMINAIDEALTPSTDNDLFRIKIWDINDADRVVYDNEMGVLDDSSPTTAITKGSIVIHK